jgi:ATPase subunit of ABC transporter with duplicated ATPase domains
VANRIIELRPTGLVDFQGGYEDFVEEHERDYLDQIAPKSEGKQKNYEEKKEERKERNRLKRDIERLEKDIANSEEKLEKINEQLAAPGFYEKTPPLMQQEVINQKDALERKRECDLNTWEDRMDVFSLKFSK